MARPVTLTTTLNNYGGDGAYLALYVTDAHGRLCRQPVDGGRQVEILRASVRLVSQPPAAIRPRSTASPGPASGPGRTLEITLDLADALFDAGYTLHIDAAVEDMREQPERNRRAADDGAGPAPRSRAAAISPASPTICKEACAMIRLLHRWPGLLALAAYHHAGAQRGGAVGVSGGRAPVGAPPPKLVRPSPIWRSACRSRYPGVEQIRRVAFGPDHRLLV